MHGAAFTPPRRSVAHLGRAPSVSCTGVRRSQNGFDNWPAVRSLDCGQACRVERGVPITPAGPSMTLLRRALGEWRTLVDQRRYAEWRAAYEEKRRKQQKKSMVCVLM